MMDTEDVETFQQQALEINEPDEDFDPEAPIVDGDQFLTHMLHERRQQPVIMVCPFFPKNSKEPSVSSNVVPADAVFKLLTEDMEAIHAFRRTTGWKKTIDKQFKLAQKTLEKARVVFNEDHLEDVEIPFTKDSEEWMEFFKNHDPSLNIMIRLNQKTLENIIEYLCDWLHERFNNDEEEDYDGKNKTSEDSVAESYNSAVSKVNSNTETKGEESPKPEQQKTLTQNQNRIDLHEKDSWFGKWSYAVFAAVDNRVGSDLIGTVREMCRILILLRHRCEPSDEYLATPYSLLIYLIAKVFRQLDLGAFV